MSKSEPTKGEWRVSRGSNFYVTTGDEDIGKACFLGHDRKEEALANARLMAASKDLLEACTALFEAAALLTSEPTPQMKAALVLGRDAIHKATAPHRVP